MTQKEFRKRISESDYSHKFKELIVNINYPHLNYSITLKGLDSVYGYIVRQNKGWTKSDMPSQLNNSKEFFKRMKSQVLDLLNGNHTSYNIDSKLRHLITQLEQSKANNVYIFTSNAPETDFLQKVYEENPNFVTGSYNYLCNINSTVQSNDLLNGLLKGYEFRYQNKTSIIKRRTNEKSAINTIKNSFENYISETENEINEIISNSKENVDNQNLKFEELVENKNSQFQNWFSKSKNEISDFNNNSYKIIEQLEDTYRKKLQLEAPARYWNKKSQKYKTDAEKAKTILIWIVSLFSIFLVLLLVIAPDWIFKTVFKDNKVAIVRWSILFITLISLLAYIIKALTRIMFSSFHLARDAEERHTLTYFYLALLKDTELNSEDRKLILQSLFSRTDTGLLKDDNGIKMPNDLIGKFIGKQ